jgi:NADPH:quinone reductase-like Zn-dependent oxidoreductase
MKAVGYSKSLPITDPNALIDLTAETPQPGPRDLRVAVKAVSVNPVDTKVRMRAEPAVGETPKILGYDAAGVVDAVGAEVTLFRPGDEVFYAGSIMIQLARKLTALTIIATASRKETRDWCLKLGADHVIDHSRPLADQLKAIGHPQIALIAGISGTEQSLPQLATIIAPQGKFALIDDPKSLDITPLKRKSVSVHWEAMFTRSLFETPDMIAQHKLLNEVAAMIDGGLIVTTAAQELSPISAANLRKAHAQIETGTTIGNVVLSGW